MDPRRRRPWQPLLEGDRAARARAIVDQVACTPDPDVGSMNHGSAGRALIHAYLGRAERAEALLDHAALQLASHAMRPDLYSGFTEIAWVAEHLQGEPEGEDGNLALDELTGDGLRCPQWPGDYDLIVGLVGLGVYALERLPRPDRPREPGRDRETSRRASGESRQRGHLADAPRAHAPRDVRQAPLRLLQPGDRPRRPRRDSRCSAAPSRRAWRPSARPALRGRLALDDGAPLPDGRGVHFPCWVDPERGHGPITRSAWRYGDPGAACALFWATPACATAPPASRSSSIACGRRPATGASPTPRRASTTPPWRPRGPSSPTTPRS
jgi:hypothetical protein